MRKNKSAVFRDLDLDLEIDIEPVEASILQTLLKVDTRRKKHFNDRKRFLERVKKLEEQQAYWKTLAKLDQDAKQDTPAESKARQMYYEVSQTLKKFKGVGTGKPTAKEKNKNLQKVGKPAKAGGGNNVSAVRAAVAKLMWDFDNTILVP